MHKTNIERVAFIVLFGIFFYVFAVKCKADRKIDKVKHPHYPYIIKKNEN